MKANDNQILRKLMRNVPKNAQILDVGCGIGDNIIYLKKLGFSNVTGCDISEEMIRICVKRGLDAVFTTNEIDKNQQYNVILMSHVIEHINEKEIQSFIEEYIYKTKENGKLIILSPLSGQHFYSDIDHVKPYNPQSIISLFSNTMRSRSYNSKIELELFDLYFRIEPVTPYFLRGKYEFASSKEKIIYRIFSHIANILFKSTFGLVSKTTGYGACFAVTNRII